MSTNSACTCRAGWRWCWRGRSTGVLWKAVNLGLSPISRTGTLSGFVRKGKFTDARGTRVAYPKPYCLTNCLLSGHARPRLLRHRNYCRRNGLYHPNSCFVMVGGSLQFYCSGPPAGHPGRRCPRSGRPAARHRRAHYHARCESGNARNRTWCFRNTPAAAASWAEARYLPAGGAGAGDPFGSAIARCAWLAAGRAKLTTSSKSTQ